MFKFTTRVSYQKRAMSGCSKSTESQCGVNYRSG